MAGRKSVVTSVLSWLDYSEHDREKVRQAISAFSERNARDELGIGVVRDAVADLLFPGTSTIQTRARYFLFIPWMYREFEDRETSSADIRRRARTEETDLIDVLADSDDKDGTIGIEARERLKRLPSNVYWQGLGRLGIRRCPWSQEQYHRMLDRWYDRRKLASRNDDGESVESAFRPNWDEGLPDPPKGFPEGASFRLRVEEAAYLRDRIASAAPGTMLAYIVTRGKRCEFDPYPWKHPQLGQFGDSIRRVLEHAKLFALAIHSGALYYNLILSELTRDEALAGDYASDLHEWASEMTSEAAAFRRWDRADFWDLVGSANARVSAPTRRFIDGWLDLALEDPARLSRGQVASARDLVTERERSLKGKQARITNDKARETWGGAAGADRLNYRWPIAWRISDDILAALEGKR